MIGSDPAHRRALLAELLRRKDQRAQPIALSAAQRRLWLLGELEPGTSTYNVPVAFRLRGPLDRRALERALNTVVRRHDVLRAIVTTNGGEPAYAVDENFALALPLVESGSPAQLDAVLAAERALPFNLGADVPIRTLLVRSSADDHVSGGRSFTARRSGGDVCRLRRVAARPVRRPAVHRASALLDRIAR